MNQNQKSTMKKEDNEEDENKEISPVIYTLLQLLSNLTLLLRDISCMENCTELGILLNEEKTKVTNYLWRNAKIKFEQLSQMTELNEEQLCVALHCWMSKFPQWWNEAYPDQLESSDYQNVLDFERRIGSYYSPFFIKFKNLYNEIKIPIESKEMNKILCEIKESQLLDDESFKRQHIPHLFLVTRHLSASNLTNQFYNDTELQHRYPLLFHTLKWIDKLECVKLLPSIAQWMKYCHMEYSGKLTKYQIQKIFADDIIRDSCKETNLIQMWEDFVKCWNTFAGQTIETKWGNFDKPIPLEKAAIVYSIAHPDNPDLRVVAMIETLQSIHNDFLQNVHSKSNIRPNQEERKMHDNSVYNNNNDVISKSLFDITPLDVISIDENTLNAIIQSCYYPTFNYGNKKDDQQIGFQFIENEIYNQTFRGHKIDISIPLFEFADELTIKHCLETLERYHPDIKNAYFDANELESVQALFDDPQQIQHAFEILSQLVVLLSHDIHKINLNETISTWMKEMNFNQKDCDLFKEENDVRLLVKHVGALWRIFDHINY
ncbi:hypothetical protein RFI_32332 [Reticulomyxa filosa]|uniref:Uncharacterized protein n=1 Tax=Reticulomyxa filosa TaxID=46433 RepID=X6LTU6_RETFI|nr:hypothetical protein RFI_32332 [Reticulomyxa filosa]|eukprot:ETO05064.1 hypothetical protein RFI_32332 [Reticulomyxa filosa]